MNLSVELPSPLGDEMSREAERQHVSPSEHAEILLSLVRSLRKEHQETASAKVVTEFLKSRSLDADLVVSVFEELVTLLLKNRCDTVSIDESYQGIDVQLPSIEEIVQKAGRVRRTSGRGSFSHIGISSEEYAKEKQEDIAREERGWR